MDHEIEAKAKSRQTASPSQFAELDSRVRRAISLARSEGSFPEVMQILMRLADYLSGGVPILPVMLALDGRAAAGKSSLGTELARLLDVHVFHMDDFYLPPEMRTDERFAEAGGNVDRERFFKDVLAPMADGKPFSYRPLIPHEWTMGSERKIRYTDMAIVEGAYTLHPMLRPFYREQISFFVHVEEEEQLRRIARRNGLASVTMFRERWIPFEEAYIATTRPDRFCIDRLEPLFAEGSNERNKIKESWENQ